MAITTWPLLYHYISRKFLWPSLRRWSKRFLKNTTKFQHRPLDVWGSFSKTQGGFRAAHWMSRAPVLGVLCGSDSRIRFPLFTSTAVIHELKAYRVFGESCFPPFNWHHKPVCVTEQIGMLCEQEFFGLWPQKVPKTDFSGQDFFGLWAFRTKLARFVARIFRELVTLSKFSLRRGRRRRSYCPVLRKCTDLGSSGF